MIKIDANHTDLAYKVKCRRIKDGKWELLAPKYSIVQRRVLFWLWDYKEYESLGREEAIELARKTLDSNKINNIYQDIMVTNAVYDPFDGRMLSGECMIWENGRWV